MHFKVKNIVIILGLLLIVFQEQSFGQDVITMKAAYLERFTRFVEWPDSVLNNKKFKILILGNNPFGDNMEILLSTTKIKERDVKILYSNDLESIKDCHLVYVSASLKNDLEQVVDLAKEYCVLTIGDTEGYAQKGIMINLFIEKDVLRFELNKKQLQGSSLKVSHLLVNVAKTHK